VKLNDRVCSSYDLLCNSLLKLCRCSCSLKHTALPIYNHASMLIDNTLLMNSGGSRGIGDASPAGTHSAPKLAILRSKIENKILASPDPSVWGERYTPHHTPRGRSRLRPHPSHQRFLDPPLLMNYCFCLPTIIMSVYIRFKILKQASTVEFIRKWFLSFSKSSLDNTRLKYRRQFEIHSLLKLCRCSCS